MITPEERQKRALFYYVRSRLLQWERTSNFNENEADYKPMAWYWQVISLIISIILKVVSYLLRPKPQKPSYDQEPGKLSENDMPIATEGEEVPVVFGCRWLSNPNVIHFDAEDIEPIEKDVSSGGKGGGK